MNQFSLDSWTPQIEKPLEGARSIIYASGTLLHPGQEAIYDSRDWIAEVPVEMALDGHFYSGTNPPFIRLRMINTAWWAFMRSARFLR